MENHGQSVMQSSIYSFLIDRKKNSFVFRPKDLNDLNNIIPKRIKKFQLFVSDDILLYSLVIIYFYVVYLINIVL